MAFRDQEIHTLDELIECHLTEDDLRDVLNVEPLYARKTLARYIREVDPPEGTSQETEMQPLIGALINNIQQGLDGDEAEEEEETFNYYKPKAESEPSFRGTTSTEVSDEPVDGDYSEYWQTWSMQLDVVARVAMPVAYFFGLIFVGVNLGKLFE